MTVDFRYDSDMVGGSLMVRESRLIAGLLIKNVNAEEWNQAIRSDNILQKRTPAAAIRNAQAIRKRLELLEPEFWQALRDGDDELATQVSLCAALERNLLLVEFMETVVADAYTTRMEALDYFLWSDFLDERSHRDASIASWKESSKKKMGQVAFRMLAEAGYLKSTRNPMLQRVLIRPEIIAMLNNTYRTRIARCLTVSIGATA